MGQKAHVTVTGVASGRALDKESRSLHAARRVNSAQNYKVRTDPPHAC